MSSFKDIECLVNTWKIIMEIYPWDNNSTDLILVTTEVNLVTDVWVNVREISVIFERSRSIQ